VWVALYCTVLLLFSSSAGSAQPMNKVDWNGEREREAIEEANPSKVLGLVHRTTVKGARRRGGAYIQ